MLAALGLLVSLRRPAGATAGDTSVRMAPATPGGVRFTVSVPAPRLARVDSLAQIDELSLPGYEGETGERGLPALPVRALLVAVPPLGEVRLTAVASETSVRDGVTLAAASERSADGKPVAAGRGLAAAGADVASATPGARLLGVTWMRNQRVARVLVSPAAYDPVTRRLTLAGRVDVELAVANPGAVGPPAEPDDPFEEVYRLTLANYDQGRAWRRPRAEALVGAAKRSGLPLRSLSALVAPPDTSLYVGRKWVKLAIQKTGFYAINFSRLKNLSLFGAGKAPFDSLRLFTWPGRTVLPEDSYCDTCDYHEVALGIVRDVGGPGGAPDSSFADDNDAIYFFAQGPDGWASDMDASRPDTSFITHPYEKSNFYYLTLATQASPVSDTTYPQPPLRIGVGAGGSRDATPLAGDTPQATVAGRLHLEQDLPSEYWPDATAIGSTLVWEKFFWRSLVSGQTFEDTLSVPDADTTRPARFRLRQWGLSENPKCNTFFSLPRDHELRVSFNNIQFPEQDWNGIRAADRAGITLDTTGVFLRRTGNSLRDSVPDIGNPANCPTRVDRSGLAFYEIYYERNLLPVDDAIEFRTHPVAGRFRYDIEPFAHSPSSYVFDVTDPLRPVVLTGASRDSLAPTDWKLAFSDTQSVSHRYMVVPDSIITNNTALLPPSQISDAPFTSLENLRSATNGADYLVIYFDGFKAAADSLAAWRRQHLPLIPTPAPHLAKAVPISAIYDQFSGGRTDPGGIRNFLRAASGWSRRPLYVAFLGDASFDFKDIKGRALAGQPGCLLPTFENNFDDFFLIRRQYATDDWLVNVNDPVAVLPDYLTGRIPAGDAAAALEVVTKKILAYERAAPFGEYRNAAVLMADDDAQAEKPDDIGWGHLRQTDILNVQHTPFEIDREYVYLHTFPSGPQASKPAARVALANDLNAGASLFNFVGHGSPFKMTDEGVMLDSDAGTLTNGLKLSLLVAASCDVGKFNDPDVQSLGERLLIQSVGGCIGVVSATEQALSNENSDLDNAVYDALFNRDTLSVAGIPLPASGQFHVPASAALLSAKTRLFFSSTNNQKYQLMGDPATLLNLPRLWSDVRFTNQAGQPIDSLARGQLVNFTGQVLDQPRGTLVPLEGVASVLIEDSAPTNVTPPSESDLNPASYRFSAGPMYHGDVSLHAGTFAGRFVVPTDAAAGVNGRIRAYVSGNTAGGTPNIDGAGNLEVVVGPGSPSGTDQEGPRITLSFVGGSTSVRPDATLQINLFDDSGIMTTGHAPQNSIIVTVDDNTTSRSDVTGTFRYAADSYQSGTASFQLPGLPPGPHQVKVSAADNLATGFDAVRHRASATIDFQVVTTPPLSVARTFLFPNPIRSGGKASGGVIVVDAPGDSINTLVRIYTVAGKLVRSLRQLGGIGQIQVVWDGLDDEGDPLAQGTYLYKVYVSAREADGRSSARKNATAVGRFVVLNR
ncbi:MAG TPA: C25 family cysteine peptidase [Candidatus Eisenbacteria bacterium]